MHITVIGTGYVGLVVGACLAETGNEVVCADVDEGKIEMLNADQIPIYEPGLSDLVARNRAQHRLRFTTDVAAAITDADVLFIAVGTPPDEDGSADLRHVLNVAEIIGRHVARETVIVTKSTVPVGTAEKVQAAVAKHAKHPFHICSNPEFLKEGAAVDDFMKPDRVVLGRRIGSRAKRDGRTICAIRSHGTADYLHGHLVGRADEVRRERDARHPHFLHERNRESL